MDPLTCERAAPFLLLSPAMNQLSRRFPADVISQPFPTPWHKLLVVNATTSGIIHFRRNVERDQIWQHNDGGGVVYGTTTMWEMTDGEPIAHGMDGWLR